MLTLNARLTNVMEAKNIIMNVTRPQKTPLYRFVLRDSGAKQINEGGSAELKYDKRMTGHLDGEKGCWDFCRRATHVRLFCW